ncbi:hypothetical protein V8F20_002732 [Naviculisporaceae sp. PSN 640]
MAPDQKRHSHTVDEDPAASSSSSSVKNLASSDVACLNAALALYKQTGERQFLRLAQDVTGRHLATPRGREGDDNDAATKKSILKMFDTKGDPMSFEEAQEAVEACKTLWPDGALNTLSPNSVLVLANISWIIKGRIPWSYDEKDQELGDVIYDVIDEAFEKAQNILGKCKESQTGLLGVGEYEDGRKLSSQVLKHIKLISDSIATDADKIIESEKQTFQVLEPLVGQQCENLALREVWGTSVSQSCESLETLKAKVQTLSKFLEGSIKILEQ